MELSKANRAFAWLLAMLLALVVAPGMAFADNLAGGTLLTTQASSEADIQKDEADWTAIKDDAVIFTVNEYASDGQVTSVPFTKKQMVELAKANTEAQYYTFTSKGSTLNTAVATEYVTIDQLLNAAKVTFEKTDKIWVAQEGYAKSDPKTYEDFNATRSYYPAAKADGGSTDGAKAVKAVVALSWEGVKSSDDETYTTAASMEAAALKGAHHSASLRNFWGKTADEFTSNMGGSDYVTGATFLNIYKPFNVYTQTGNGAKTLKGSLYYNDLLELAKANEDAKAFLYNKNGWQVGVATKYVDANVLAKKVMGDSFALADNQAYVFAASDGFKTTLQAAQVKNGKYFYPATTASNIEATGQEEVGTILALEWGTTEKDKDAITTAGEAKMKLAASDSLAVQYRVFTGLSSISDPNTGGNRFATGPVELSITTRKSVADSSIAISGVKASYDYTGSAIEPAVTVKDGSTTLSAATKKGGDYTVEYQNNVAAGTAKVIVTGVNSYSGTKTIEFKVNPLDISKATVALSKASATYNGKAQKGAVKSVKLGSTTLKSGTDYTVSAKSGKAAGSYAVTVTGKGNYKGSATATYKITPADISKAAVTLSKASAAYTGKAQKGAVKSVKLGSTALKSGTDFKVSAKSGKAVGSYVVTVTGKGNYKGSAKATFKVKQAANKATAKKTSVKKTLKATALKKKAQTVALPKVTAKFGTAKWKVSAKDKKGVLKLKSGKIQVKKGAKKGTYTIKLKASVAKTKNYKAATTKVVTVKVTVK